MRQSFLLGVGRVLISQAGTERLFARPAVVVQRDRNVASSSLPPAPTIACLVDRDAVNPGFQVCIAAKAADALKSSQESFLRQVARLFRVGGQAIKQSVNVRRALSHQALKGRNLSAPQSFKELIFDSRTNFRCSCRGNLFQIRMPSEGDLLSVAH